jgi:hypothetical protein
MTFPGTSKSEGTDEAAVSDISIGLGSDSEITGRLIKTLDLTDQDSNRLRRTIERIATPPWNIAFRAFWTVLTETQPIRARVADRQAKANHHKRRHLSRGPVQVVHGITDAKEVSPIRRVSVSPVGQAFPM